METIYPALMNTFSTVQPAHRPTVNQSAGITSLTYRKQADDTSRDAGKQTRLKRLLPA